MLWIKRVLWVLAVLMAVIVSVTVSGLNTQAVTLDLYYWRWSLTLGVAVLLALLTGVLLGWVLVLTFHVLPLKSKQRRLRRALRQQPVQQVAQPHATSAPASADDDAA